MKYRFFTVRAQSPDLDQEALNAFCAQRRVVAVEKHLVADGGASFWAVCVSYLEGADGVRGGSGSKRDRIDYKEVLNATDFAVFSDLRVLRKTLAEQEGIPVYALFSNEQLAEMVTRRALTLAALGAIEGVGEARVEKFGPRFLALLQPAFADSVDLPHETHSTDPV